MATDGDFSVVNNRSASDDTQPTAATAATQAAAPAGRALAQTLRSHACASGVLRPGVYTLTNPPSDTGRFHVSKVYRFGA